MGGAYSREEGDGTAAARPSIGERNLVETEDGGPGPCAPLPTRDLEGIATRLREGAKLSMFAGAGMSVASGIPDFRSAGGLYATLDAGALTATPEQVAKIRRVNEYVLSRELFVENPLPYLELRR